MAGREQSFMDLSLKILNSETDVSQVSPSHGEGVKPAVISQHCEGRLSGANSLSLRAANYRIRGIVPKYQQAEAMR